MTTKTLDKPAFPARAVTSLTVQDRCDHKECSSQALVRVSFRDVLILDFCGHHYTAQEPSLAAKGAFVNQDLRGSLR